MTILATLLGLSLMAIGSIGYFPASVPGDPSVRRAGFAILIGAAIAGLGRVL